MPIQRQCPHCDRHFTRTEHLLRHVRTHTKEKPFKCKVCNKSYSREDTLVRHAKSHLPGCDGREDEIKGPTESPGREMPRSPQGSPDGTAQSVQSQSSHSDQAPTGNELSHSVQDMNEYVPSQEDLLAFGMVGTPQFQMSIHSPESAWDFWNAPFTEVSQTSVSNGSFAANAVNVMHDQALDQDMELQHQESPTNRHSSEVPSPSDFNVPPPINNVERIWFTKLRANEDRRKLSSTSIAGATPPLTHCSELTDVDDAYRLQLTKAVLTPQPTDDPLPASDFLNLCVRMYFTRFNPIFPILHSATYRPTADNSLLILSMTSIGCLFLGSPAAVQRGRQIFRRLNKAILGSWDSLIMLPNGEPLAMLQAAVLGQTFALLSGDPRDLTQCETFHGSVITLARRTRMFGLKAAISDVHSMSGPDIETTWRSWARREEINRVCAALRIHDAELCALSHTEPLLRHGASQSPPLCSSRMFSASTAVEWASVVQTEAAMSVTFMGNSQTQQIFSFSAYVSLEGIGTSISRDRQEGRLTEMAVSSYDNSLISWYHNYSGSATNEQPGQLSLIMLWHWVYMCLLVDFDQLECAIGRDGPEAAESGIKYISAWVSSPDSARCVLHAFLAQRQLQTLPFDSVPAVHVPRILFSAAVAWYCYLQYGSANAIGTPHFPELGAHSAEFHILDSPGKQQLSEIIQLSWKKGSTSDVKAVTLCELGDLLQHIKHWGIARAFAKIVACLIYRDPQDIAGD